ncbi:MAG: carbon monoxide dehydrogenase subunit G [Ancalomicrobiaceae bacterium]|nr:carbon monoxide dehydrogenase subunit G [Ancalomicrobiaceae bacterium]
MEMTGEYRIPATRAEVWAALNDPDVLRVSIPGCETLDMSSPTDMTAKVVTKIGPVKATFSGRVKLENINPPNGYTISGEGSGGVAGSARGGADVTLTEDGDETVLAYAAHAHVSGKLAQLGSRLIDATAKMMADQFFAKFSAVVVERLNPPEEEAAAAAVDAGPAAATPEGMPMATATATPGAAPMATAEALPRRVASKVHSAAPISVGSLVPGWVWPLAALIVGILIGKFVI